jgi:glycosyltransferase involved in cell wall biosynthesis
MQEIKKRRIVIASVLKPVNDPRMFEKFGQSLSSQYEVHIFGTEGVINIAASTIIFHPLSSYTRLSFDRLLAPFKVLTKILQLRPAVVIICTHELLWMVLVAKLFLSCKIVYDIRENYFRNILYTNAFPPIIRVLIALYVRAKEWITSPLINCFFLAEAGYARELRFIGNNGLILENKLKKVTLPAAKKWSAHDLNFHLLFSGTLGSSTGVFIAINMAIKLHEVDPRFRLHIVGFSPIQAVRLQIKELTRHHDFIHFRESNVPIPHLEILEAIQMADMGVIAYPANLATENTIPTKLFEYLGYSLPILLIDHAPWVEICRPYRAAITFDPQNLNAGSLAQAITNTNFYTSPPENIFWDTEEKKLLQTVSELLK